MRTGTYTETIGRIIASQPWAGLCLSKASRKTPMIEDEIKPVDGEETTPDMAEDAEVVAEETPAVAEEGMDKGDEEVVA
ncbi:MAG: hypothetical protein AB202_02740 [Parcubacteria bacterium C7867-007]|nr:MAG: hypothetical protein AB202_02740 [Parcubacteria bacterium C7867-007]